MPPAPRRTGYDSSGRWRVEHHQGDPEGVRAMLTRLEQDVADGNRMPPSDVVLDRLVNAARRDDGLPTRQMGVRLQILAKQCGLSRAERLELAEVILRRDVTTWADFTQREALTMTAALEGFGFIAHLQAEQGRRWRFGSCTAQPCPMRTGT